jgi:hypothetical protein
MSVSVLTVTKSRRNLIGNGESLPTIREIVMKQKTTLVLAAAAAIGAATMTTFAQPV